MTPEQIAANYEQWVSRVAAAIHETCRLEWQAIAAVDPGRMVTQHGPDAHYGMAHDLVRRLNLNGEHREQIAGSPTMPDTLSGAAPLTDEETARLRALVGYGPKGDRLVDLVRAERQATLALLAHIDALTAAATKTRDRLAWWMWSEDDSGDSNDLVAAYDELRSILGPSTEEGVAATLAGEPHDA